MICRFKIEKLWNKKKKKNLEEENNNDKTKRLARRSESHGI